MSIFFFFIKYFIGLLLVVSVISALPYHSKTLGNACRTDNECGLEECCVKAISFYPDYTQEEIGKCSTYLNEAEPCTFWMWNSCGCREGLICKDETPNPFAGIDLSGINLNFTNINFGFGGNKGFVSLPQWYCRQPETK